jgi:hypothetical protein
MDGGGGTMSESDYLDFDLKIERTAAGYRTEVVCSPGGEAANDFTLPFSDLELENFLLRIGRPRRGLRRLESPEMASAKEFGGRLFRAAFGADIRSCFRGSLDEANRRGGRLRIRLRLKDAPEMADLPWEFLYNPELNRFYCLSVETPIVRYLDLPMQITPLALQPPLRILVMIASPQDYEKLDVEGEWAKLQEALAGQIASGAVAVERLAPATLPALRERLRRNGCHVFHFIGHGAFDESAQDGVLLLEDAGGRGRPTSGESLGMVLRDQRTLRLAVVNACEGGRTSRTDPFAGVAQSLLQQGIPAVIGMQFPISDAAAAAFSREFYAAVATGYPLDAALSEARKAILTDVNDVEWGTPVLYMRSADAHIFGKWVSPSPGVNPARPTTLPEEVRARPKPKDLPR